MSTATPSPTTPTRAPAGRPRTIDISQDQRVPFSRLVAVETRKSFDTFSPVGPYLVTPDEAGPWEDMELRTWVAGELRQDADVADLIWGIPALIEYASSVMVLEPGDILTSGTPAGIGQVRAGDTIAVEITRVGRLEVTVSDEGAVACPTRGANRGPKPPDTVTPVRPR